MYLENEKDMVKKNKITLAEAMDCSGLKTEFIAKNVGVSRQTIYNYKHGNVDIPYSNKELVREEYSTFGFFFSMFF